MKRTSLEMNFCRRCGAPLTNDHDHVYKCKNGHLLYSNSVPTTSLIFTNSKGELLLVERSIDPGKGLLDIPGGFCDGTETLEEALAREMSEEMGLAPNNYSTPEYVTSGIDLYEYMGEKIPALSIVFVASLQEEARPVLNNENARMLYVAPTDLDFDKVYFPSICKALKCYISRLDKAT